MAKRDSNGDSFVTITNKDIYDKLEKLELKVSNGFESVNKRQDITNGKVKLTKWIATTALSLVLVAVTILVNHIGRN